ncbi:MAG: hypothetical protein FJY11_07520 [Bacteroidetes bacterium]|nr:hypothetical protein [Bacteroidota bacterium]
MVIILGQVVPSGWLTVITGHESATSRLPFVKPSLPAPSRAIEAISTELNMSSKMVSVTASSSARLMSESVSFPLFSHEFRKKPAPLLLIRMQTFS